MPPAVIFDMDGVLVDSYQAHYKSWRAMYREQGEDYSEADFAADFGRTSGEILRGRFGEELSKDRIRELDDRKEALYREIIRRKFPVMDGAVELVDALVADGFLLAVGSSGPPENVALSIESLGRAGRFQAVVSRQDVTRGKPDPQVFQIAAQRLGVSPGQCMVVEDAVHGVEAAHRAGMACVAITGTTSREELSQADLVVDSLRELEPRRLRTLLNNNESTRTG